MRWRSPLAFVWCAFGIVLLAGGIYFGPQTVTYFRLRPLLLTSTDYPPRGWSSVPRPLADTKVSTAEVSILSFYGYRFEVPWKEIDKEWNDGRTVRVRFKTGETVTFNNPEYSQNNPINSDFAKDDRDSFKMAFGRGMSESKYDQLRAVLSTTPSQLSPFRWHTEFARVWILLEIKGLWFEHNTAPPDIFSFETNDYRGFELSGLSHDWQDVTVNLFDTANHWFVVNIQGDELRGVKITQPEINVVIHSFGFIHSDTSPSGLLNALPAK